TEISPGPKTLAPVAVVQRDKSCEISLLFDPDITPVDCLSFLIDGTAIISPDLGFGGSPRIRFENLIENSEFGAAERSYWMVVREKGSTHRLKINFNADLTLDGAGTAYVWMRSPESGVRIDYVLENEQAVEFEVEAGA